MTLRVIQHHLHLNGMPSTPRGSRPAQKAIACHDTEGEAGLQGAWNTISWMVATGPIRNASYNEFWAYENGVLTVIVVVPPTHAAHSIAPQPTSPTSGLPLYQPDEQVKAALGATVNDPNMWVYAVSIAGTVADVERYANDHTFVLAARERMNQLGYGPLLEHFRFNPRTRTDWGPSLTGAILEDDVIVKTPIRRAEWWTKIGPASTFTRSDGTQGHFTARERVTSIADLTLDNGTRGLLLCYGEKHEALVMSRAGADGPPITESLGCGSGSDATCQAELASAKQTIEAQTDIIAEQKSKIAAAKLALE